MDANSIVGGVPAYSSAETTMTPQELEDILSDGPVHIPRKPLLGALKKGKAKVSRSDQKNQTALFTRSGDYWVEATIELD